MRLRRRDRPELANGPLMRQRARRQDRRPLGERWASRRSRRGVEFAEAKRRYVFRRDLRRVQGHLHERASSDGSAAIVQFALRRGGAHAQQFSVPLGPRAPQPRPTARGPSGSAFSEHEPVAPAVEKGGSLPRLRRSVTARGTGRELVKHLIELVGASSHDGRRAIVAEQPKRERDRREGRGFFVAERHVRSPQPYSIPQRLAGALPTVLLKFIADTPAAPRAMRLSRYSTVVCTPAVLVPKDADADADLLVV